MIPHWMKRLSWYTLALAVVVGGLVHITATLVAPRYMTATPFQRLSALLPVNRMRILPPVEAASQPLPYVGPDVRLAVCKFDLSDGPVVLTAALPDSGWLLALYTVWGDNFYVMPAQDGRSGVQSITLHPPGQRSFSLLSLSSLSLGTRSKVTSPSEVEAPRTTGFAVIRAPLRGRAFSGETEATLKRAACEVRRG